MINLKGLNGVEIDRVKKAYSQGMTDGISIGRADAIDELFKKKVFNNNTESIFDISLKECRNDFDDGWNRCYHDFEEIAEQLKSQIQDR